MAFGTQHRWNQDRSRQRPIGMKSLVVVLALLLAACSSGSHPTAARPTTTTVSSTVQPTTTTPTITQSKVTEAGTRRYVATHIYLRLHRATHLTAVARNDRAPLLQQQHVDWI